MDFTELKDFLDSKVIEYNNTQFIESDPISIPHSFDKKEDIEISALLVATIAWGQRKTIINNGNKMMELMDNSPHDFILNHSDQELKSLSSFKHRTFNGDDFMFFIAQLKRIYQNYGNLEKVFQQGLKPNSINCLPAIENFRNTFFYQISEENRRTMKHVSSPAKGSAAKSKKRNVKNLGLLSVFGNKGVQAKMDAASSGSGELQGLADKSTGYTGSRSGRAGNQSGSRLKSTGAGGTGTATVGISGVGTRGGSGTGRSGNGSGGIGARAKTDFQFGGEERIFKYGLVEQTQAVERAIRHGHCRT